MTRASIFGVTSNAFASGRENLQIRYSVSVRYRSPHNGQRGVRFVPRNLDTHPL